MGEKIATRNAYGMALAELAPKYPELVVFDAPGGPIAIRRDCKGKQKT